ncbi:AmmeMemoRadiSam system protein A [Gudongella sp. DL1XJH-153]|uniref:AmmeMemoRadiSam system protein A n=1 Tax=Gudongella sp. DL1XJH-153 TaxID=3409804 RepID=UPI003BB7B488
MGKLLSAYLMPHPPVLVGEIGQGQEELAGDTLVSMEEIGRDIASKKPGTIIVITPHGPLFSDAHSISMEENLKGDFGAFGHNELSYSYQNNLDLTYGIVKKALEEGITLAQMTREMNKRYGVDGKLDHGVLVPLHFVDKYYGDFKVIPITYGLLPPGELHQFGKVIDESIKSAKSDVCVIASGDLSHKLKDSGPYSYVKEGPEFDKKIMDAIRDANLIDIAGFPMDLAEKAGECGLRSLMILAGILSGYNISSTVLSYEGPFGVGYGTAIFNIEGESDKDISSDISRIEMETVEKRRATEDEFVNLARRSLEHYVKTVEYMEVPDGLSHELLNERFPVFVSIKKNGSLRGCIGATEAIKDNIAQEIIYYSVQAGTRDPRFDSVQEDELQSLVYSVDVLMKPESVDDASGLDPSTFGVIVKKEYKRGLLLPNLEGVDTVEEQLRIALNKAGIDSDEDYSIERFRVVRHH